MILTWSRTRLEVSGPLAPFAAEFTEWLQDNGYTPATMRIHQRRMTHLSCWMDAEKVSLGRFGWATVDAFIALQDAAGRFRAWRAGSWSALVEYLRLAGGAGRGPAAAGGGCRRCGAGRLCRL
jgi:hypothetical protein